MVQLPTSRVTGVYWETDYPGEPDARTKRDLTELFDYVAGSYPEPEGRYISGGHAGIAQLAQSPRIALGVLKATHAVLGEGTWSAEHLALRELIVQTVNLHFKAEYCFQAHVAVAQRAGLSVEQQSMIPYWRTASHVFSDEQRQIIEYTFAVCSGEVPDEMFARMVAKYGERGAMEATAIIGMWSLWAMVLNATRTKFDFKFGDAGQAPA